MRHRNTTEKFSRPRAQRKALINTLLRSLIIYESIKTTETKAKNLRGWADKLITWGKENTLHTRRLAYRVLKDHKLVKKLFDEIAPRFTEKPGGYTRVIPLRIRKGDGAKISILELSQLKEKTDKKTTAKAAKEAKAAVKAIKPAKTKTEDKPKKGIVDGVKNIFKKAPKKDEPKKAQPAPKKTVKKTDKDTKKK
jgi:large subunit ribosomal protein L17